MVDIQSATISLAATAQSSTSTAPLIPVPVGITSVPQTLASLERSIQINATPAAISAANEITLITTLGSISITLTAQISATERQVLLQQLLAMTEAQKPVTLSLQAGAPPTQAVLLVPNISTPAASQNVAVTPAALPGAVIPNLAVGDTLPAIILPSAAQQAAPVPVAQNQPVAAPPPMKDFPPAQSLSVLFDAAARQEAPPAHPVAPQTAPAPDFVPVQAADIPEIVVAPVAVAEFMPLQPQSTPAVTALAPSTPQAIQPQPLPAPQSPAPVAGFSFVPQTPSAAPPQPPALFVLLHPGNEVTVRVDEIIAPPLAQNAAAPPLPALASNQIAATVSGTGPNGQMILKAGGTTLFIKAPATVPAGSTLILTVEAPKPEQLLVLPQNDAENFPSLPQAVAALAQNDPQILAQMMATRMPQPTQYLPGALLFLFSAFKQGNVGGWLGESATDSLVRMGKADIVASLSHELSSAGQITQDPVVGEWQSYPIPLYSGQQFQALTLYVHSDRDARQDRPGSAAPGAGKIRFLIDMRLSRLGAMQIDGFVQAKKLDMIFRSEAVLPEGLHNELRTAYIKALGAVGFTGALNFQVGRQHWMRMQRTAQGILT